MHDHVYSQRAFFRKTASWYCDLGAGHFCDCSQSLTLLPGGCCAISSLVIALMLLPVGRLLLQQPRNRLDFVSRGRCGTISNLVSGAARRSRCRALRSFFLCCVHCVPTQTSVPAQTSALSQTSRTDVLAMPLAVFSLFSQRSSFMRCRELALSHSGCIGRFR